jgi:hypothetical protein
VTPGLRSRANRRWALAVAACALLVALIVSSPVWRFRLDAGAAYQGIVFNGASDGEQYVTLLRRTADGTSGRKSDIIYEWRSAADKAEIAPQSLGYRLYLAGYPMLVADLHVYVAIVTAICAALHLLLFVGIGRALRLSRPAALACALAACLVPWLWSFEGGHRWLFAPDRAVIDFLPLYRPVNPSFSGLFLWTTLLLALRWLRSPKWRHVIAMTVLATLAGDVYMPVFTVTGGLLGAAALIAFLHGRRLQPAALLAGGAIALIASLRTVLSFGAAQGTPLAAMQANQSAVPFSDPIVTWDVATALVLGACAAFACRRRRLSAQRQLVVFGAPLVMLVVFNSHLVTGRIYQPFHYDWFFTVPFIWLSAGVLVARAVSLLPRIRNATARPATRRIADIGAAAAAIVVLLAAAMPSMSGRVLHALGVIRSDQLQRPGVFAAASLAAIASVWTCVFLVRTGRRRALRAFLCAGVALAAVTEGWRIQQHGLRRRTPEHLEYQKLGPMFDWLRDHADPNAVVMCGNGGIPRLVASYTGRNVFISLEAMFSLYPPEDEFRDRRYIWLATYGVTPEKLAAELGDTGRWHYDIFKWRTFGPPPPKLSFLSYGRHTVPLLPEDADRVLAEYRAVWSLPNAAKWTRYRTDYVLWTDFDPKDFRDPAPDPSLTLSFASPGVRLYRVTPQ